MSMRTLPSALPLPESCRTVKFGVRSECQSTARGSTSLPAASSTRMLHARDIAGSLRILVTMSFFRIDSGTVQVGLRFTAVICVVSVGDGRSTLPTTVT